MYVRVQENSTAGARRCLSIWGEGGDLQESLRSVDSLFLLFSCRRAPCPAANPRTEGCRGLPAPSLPPGPARRAAPKRRGEGCMSAGVRETRGKTRDPPGGSSAAAPRTVRRRAAWNSVRHRGGAPRRARPWELGGRRRRLGGHQRGNPVEVAPRKKVCLLWRASDPPAAAERASRALAAICASEKRDLSARPRSAQKVEKNADWTARKT